MTYTPATYDAQMFIDTFEHEYTWLNGFMRNVRRYGNRPALIDPSTETTWTYKELDAECNQLAHALKCPGPRAGPLVGSRLPGLRSSSPRGPMGARLLSQEKEATETHFGFETVSEVEKGGKGERGERVNGEDLTV